MSEYITMDGDIEIRSEYPLHTYTIETKTACNDALERYVAISCKIKRELIKGRSLDDIYREFRSEISEFRKIIPREDYLKLINTN